MKDIQHPGAYVRGDVIPNGMNVTNAAKLVGVSRPTLSNFLNGNADLSPEMAGRLETAFGVPARKLLDLQSAWDAAHKTRTALAQFTKTYVPPFLNLTASRIEAWADSGLAPRRRLAVFLRALVHSANVELTEVDFPGNDDSERPGWDGQVNALRATPWIPEGRSGWEFGVNANPLAKANGDYGKSVDAVKPADRKTMTFVFVTPRSWKGKDAWVRVQKAKKQWRDVRAYDASDLEQWLEQSPAAQTWFASETEQASEGTLSLEKAWALWSADCQPPLSPQLFADSLRDFTPVIRKALSADKFQPVIITADSRAEAVAFLSACLAATEDLAQYRDRIILFNQPGALGKLAAQVTNFIPVITSRDVEREFSPYREHMPSFIIYPRNAVADDPDIELETLNDDTFRSALEKMGLDHDRIEQLDRESGRSLTVLRRRLSSLPAIKSPDWASDSLVATSLIPFLLAGAWRSDNAMDKAMVEALAGDVLYPALERRIAALLLEDGTPLWSAGALRGVVSKIDLLYAVGHMITVDDLQRFFDVAELVLGERNPALDLPEGERWKAGLFGKTRQISGPLRNGLAETLVLLTVHGNNVFKGRHGFDTPAHADRLVRSLLSPFSAETLESQNDNLPLYAEAAPETFLSLVEADLALHAPVTLELMRPVTDTMFGGSAPRTGLLWALENLAWSRPLFMRTVLVLGRLSERKIDDNLVNKPSGSLNAIFRCWMPQTSADLPARKLAFEGLMRENRQAAWPIAMDQIDTRHKIGFHSHKPRWRPDGHGFGQVVDYAEMHEFALFALDLALAQTDLTVTMAGDLVGVLPSLEESLQLRVWDVVDRFIFVASDPDKAILRETIRLNTKTKRARINRDAAADRAAIGRAAAAYERLKPTDLIQTHAWLFKTVWVEDSADEEEDYDFSKRAEKIDALRKGAVREVFQAQGAGGLLRLAKVGEARAHVGSAFAEITPGDGTLAHVIVDLIGQGEMTGALADLVAGMLRKSSFQNRSVLHDVLLAISEDKLVATLIAAPFNRSTWEEVDRRNLDISSAYWSMVHPDWTREPEEMLFAANHFLQVGRPSVAFKTLHFDMEQVPATFLYDLLVSLVQTPEDRDRLYLPNRHDLTKAFEVLTATGAIGTEAMAMLEFQYIHIFDHSSVRPVNIERQVEIDPDWFVQAVAFTFKRRDGGIDPVEWDAVNDDMKAARADSSYTLLRALSRIPGHTAEGKLEADLIIKWIEAVRSGCAAVGRQDIGDQMIGQLMSHADKDEEGIWPCSPVRDALERVMTEHIGSGLTMALFNQRGAHWRGSGGGQERALADTYARWASATEYTHPRLATILRQMERNYLHDAGREDQEARISRRLNH